jgi:dihydrofolate reductase
MATVIADMSVSLDGFIADPSDRLGPLFDWFGNGSVEFTFPGDGRTAQVSDTNASHLNEFVGRAGALVCGRRLFDHTSGWNGSHPVGVPVFVVSHSVPNSVPEGSTPFTFVTSGVADAVAQASAVAGDNVVAIASASIAQQCLAAGLLDAVSVNLVPVMLGQGIRWFTEFSGDPVMFENPSVVEGDAVTHLLYRVRK